MLIMYRRLFASLIFTLLAASTPLNLFGQAVSGNIIGTVTDPSGAAVGGAEVSIANVGTGGSNQTTTNESGNYTAANLPAALHGHHHETGFSEVHPTERHRKRFAIHSG